jgi:hypothetical protein
LGDQLVLNIDQIIPPPEAKELMIGINAKEAEEKNTEVVVKNRHKIRRDYWQQLLDTFQASSCSLFNNISASKDHWLSAGSGLSSCPYTLIFLQKELRVELSINRRVTGENKFIYDFLFSAKDQIEADFGDQMKWMRLDDKKMSRVQFSCFSEGYNQDVWQESIAWHLDKISRLEKAFSKPIQKAAEKLKLHSFE